MLRRGPSLALALSFALLASAAVGCAVDDQEEESGASDDIGISDRAANDSANVAAKMNELLF